VSQRYSLQDVEDDDEYGDDKDSEESEDEGDGDNDEEVCNLEHYGTTPD